MASIVTIGPRPAPLGRLLVLEKTGSWATALRRRGTLAGAGLVETRSLAQCAAELAIAPLSLVLIEATAHNLPTVCEQILAWERLFPNARAVVVLAVDLQRWEAALREAGAVHVIDSQRRLAEIDQLAVRHWRQHPQRAAGPGDQIWASLPWSLERP